MKDEIDNIIKELTPVKINMLRKSLDRPDGLIRGGVVRTIDTLRLMKLIEITSIYFQGRRTYKLTEIGTEVLNRLQTK